MQLSRIPLDWDFFKLGKRIPATTAITATNTITSSNVVASSLGLLRRTFMGSNQAAAMPAM